MPRRQPLYALAILSLALGFSTVPAWGQGASGEGRMQHRAQRTAPKGEDRAEAEALARVATLERTRAAGVRKLGVLAKDPRARVRRAAIRALGRAQTERALTALTHGLQDKVAPVRAEAAFALGQLSGLTPPPKQAISVLLDRFPTAQHPAVRLAIVTALGKLGGPTETAFLLTRSADADPKVRAAAFTGLGLIAHRSGGQTSATAATLERGLLDPEAEVRAGAAYLLMRATRLDAAQASAIRCARDTDPQVRVYCVRALERAGDDAKAQLTMALGDRDWHVRIQAVRALAGLRATTALAAFIQKGAHRLSAKTLAFDRPGLHPLISALDACLALPSDDAVLDAAKAIVAISKPVAGSPNTLLGRAHLHCRALTLIHRTTGKSGEVRRCGGPGFPNALREPFIVATLDGTPQKARRHKRLTKFWKTAGSRGRVAMLERLNADDKASGHAAELLSGALTSADPAEVATAAQAATRLSLGALDRAMIQAYRRMYPAGEIEAVVALFKALGALKSEAAGRVLEEHIFDPRVAISRAAVKALQQIQGHNARFPARPPMVVSGMDQPDLRLARRAPQQTARLHTTRGIIDLRLYRSDAPQTVKNFVRLAKKGFYSGQMFHRVVPGFVAQVGDPRGDGWGGPGYTIPCEINRIPFGAGTVGMALAGKDTGGSQFFITHGPQPHLDGDYTVFAQITKGQAVADSLMPGDKLLRVELPAR